MSQPLSYSLYNDSDRNAYSQNPYGMSEDEKDEKRYQFRQFLETELENNLRNENEDTVELDVPTMNDKHFYYFIGRLNPPHDGHILALESLVQKAQESNSIPLILLGSGPGKKQTLDNPIPFELKKQFIEKKLLECGIRPDSYEIKEMSNPASQVAEYIGYGLESGINYDNISITHVAGGKDEDTTKLAFALNSGQAKAKLVAPESNVEASTFAVEPKQSSSGQKAMSATEVRRSVYQNYVDGKTFADWNPKYKEFYGDMSENIYNAILEPAKQLANQDIYKYISTGTLPSITTSKKRKLSGGYKRRTNKRRTNKRRSNKRRTNKIYRRKRKTQKRV
jgi:nicotinamide mononucleotide adenylyltransferase